MVPVTLEVRSQVERRRGKNSKASKDPKGSKRRFTAFGLSASVRVLPCLSVANSLLFLVLIRVDPRSSAAVFLGRFR